MSASKQVLTARIRDKRAKLDATFHALDAQVTALTLLPRQVRRDVVTAGRWAGVIFTVTAIALFSALVVSAALNARRRSR